MKIGEPGGTIPPRIPRSASPHPPQVLFHSRGQQLCKLIGTIEKCSTSVFNSHRFAYGHEHDRSLIVSGHQYGGCDVMWNALYQWQSHSLVKKKALWTRRSPNSWTSQSCFLSSNWFYECVHPFIDKPMVITEPTVQLYPSNILMYRLPEVPQKPLSERKALLTGWKRM